MAITTNFTNLKGDTGDTGDSIVVENLVQSSVAGSDTTFDLVQKDSSGATVVTTPVTVQGGVAGRTILTGTTAPDVADGNIGDVYINTTTDELFKKVAADDWGTSSDFTGDKGDKGDTGETGTGFNAYDTTGATTYTTGNIVVSGNTQWRALRDSTNVTPVEGDDWSEISTLSQDQFVTSIDDLSDVDTTATVPSDGDTLVWSTDKWIPGTPEGGGGLFGEFELARTPLTLTLTFTGTTFNEHRITHPSNTLPAYFNQVSGITLGVGFSFIFGWEDNAGVPLQGNGFGASANGLWIQGGTDSAITDYVDDLITNINAISTDAAGTEGTLNVGANRITIQRLCVATRGAGNSVVLTQLDDTFVADPVTTSDFSNGITEVFAQSASVIADKTYAIRSPILHLSEAYVCIEGYDATSTSLLPAADTTHWKSLT